MPRRAASRDHDDHYIPAARCELSEARSFELRNSSYGDESILAKKPAVVERLWQSTLTGG